MGKEIRLNSHRAAVPARTLNGDAPFGFIPVPYGPFRDLLEEVRQIKEMLAGVGGTTSPWLDVSGAADYLATSTDAIYALVKRRQIPFHKAPNGRLMFDRGELDGWARGEADSPW
jgi:excisionase family DNA binding protein